MEKNPELNPSWLLIRAFIPAKIRFAKIADQSGLTFMQLMTLCLVEPSGKGSTMHTLIDTLGCDASNVTVLVEKLVGQGFLERRESPDDRRVKIIYPTVKGKRARTKALRTFASEDIFGNLNPHEADMLGYLLAKALKADS